MVRERVTPEMDQLMRSMEARMDQIAQDAKRLSKAKTPGKSAELQRRIQDGRVWLNDAGKQLREMKRKLSMTKDAQDG